MPDFIERIPPWVWITIVAHLVVLGTVAYLILLERKVASWVQDRIGPNRVGFDFGILPIKFHFWGLGQPLADGLKFIFKEHYRAGDHDHRRDRLYRRPPLGRHAAEDEAGRRRRSSRGQ